MSKFYCNQKFWWLSVDLEKQQTFSCCAATPQRVDMDWVQKNPGQLFNTPILQQERQMMLDDQQVASCSASCWIPESQGMPSRRTSMSGLEFTHKNTVSQPETLNIIVGTDCNMTCVYCCKYYSTAWTRDIAQSQYPVDRDDDRYTINDTDRVLQLLSQKEVARSAKRDLLLRESVAASQSPLMKEVMITGGEPFLYGALDELLGMIPTHVPIRIYSGLGVDQKRFKKEIKKLPKNAKVIISAESIGAIYEFVRYGNTWERFNSNILELQTQEIDFEFNATVTNLTLPGLIDFQLWAGTIPVNFQPCTDPDFLAIGVLDPDTKKMIKDNLLGFPEFVASALEVEPTQKQISNLRSYIKEFAQRRSLDLDIFPPSMSAWLQQ